MSAPELDVVLAGGEAQPALVWLLAPALGLQVADLFVIAGLDLPDGLAAATGTVSWNVGRLMQDASRLVPEGRERLHKIVRSLPVVAPTGPARPASSYPPGPATTLLRLLENRNIHPWNARLLCVVGDGPYVSDSTVAGVGRGRVALTPRYVTAFANVLGIPAGDLTAVTGVGPSVATGHPPHPQRAELAAFGLGRSTANQRPTPADQEPGPRTVGGRSALVVHHVPVVPRTRPGADRGATGGDLAGAPSICAKPSIPTR